MSCVFGGISDAQLHDVSLRSENFEFQGSIKSETEKLMQSEEAYFSRTGNSERIPSVLSAQFAENIARSRQSDMYIWEYGELMVDLSVKYTSQAVNVWNQIKNLLEGGETNENND